MISMPYLGSPICEKLCEKQYSSRYVFLTIVEYFSYFDIFLVVKAFQELYFWVERMLIMQNSSWNT